MISEKRAWRHDFLRAFGRVFDYDLSGTVIVGTIDKCFQPLSTVA